MRRWLLDLCLLAYPRALRGRDRDYLRALALELVERHGLARQAISLLLGGVQERASSAGRWGRRLGAASLIGVAVAFGGLVISAGADGSHEVDRFACAASAASSGSGCAARARSLVSARVRMGWRCTPSAGAPDALHVSLQCTRDR